jgi:hypothetical protein
VKKPVESLERRTYFSPLAFSAPTRFATGEHPSGVVAADLSGNGRIDLVTSNFSDNTISVLMGNGNGTFQPALSYLVGTSPQALAVGDLNGDGIPDIVTANEGSNTISVLMGNGDGTFAPQVTYEVGVRPEAIAAADLQGDGHTDIVTANQGSNTVSVLLNNGDGSFAPAVDYFTGSGPDGLAVGDLNGDGKPDIVTVNPINSNLHVLLNNGDATFGHLETYLTGLAPRAVTIADINSDGRPDIITANLHDTNISVLKANGDGTFQTQENFATGSFPFAVTVADVNGDGRPDIITANNFDSGVSVLLHNTMGSFSQDKSIRSGTGPVALVAADVNGDGKPDLIAADFNTNTVSVDFNQTIFVPLIPTTTTLTPGQNPVQLKNKLTLTAQISPSSIGARNPVGVVQFFDGGKVIGIGTLSPTGVAKITTKLLTVGTHVISAHYGGDGTYHDSLSTQTMEVVVTADQAVPLLSPTVSSVKLPTSYVAGDHGVVNVSITDTGAGVARGVVGVQLFASLSSTFDSSAFQIAGAGNSQVGIQVAGGTSKNVGIGFKVPANLSPGTYTYFAVVSPVSGLTSQQVDSTPAVGITTSQSVLEFGKVGAHRGYKLTRTLANGTAVTLTLSGAGTGVLTESPDGGISLALNGTAGGSNLSIISSGVTLDGLTAPGPMGNVTAPTTTVDGAFTLSLGVRKLTIAGATNCAIAVNGGAANRMSLGTLSGVNLFSAAPILSLALNSFSNTPTDSILTAWIGTLTCAGDFGAALLLNGGNGRKQLGLATASIGGSVSTALWSIQKNVGTVQVGNIGTGWSGSIHGSLASLTDTGDFAGELAAHDIGDLHISGSLTNAKVFTGADFGADARLGNNDDFFGSGVLSSLIINGSVTNSFVAAGYSVTTASLLPRSAIGSISVSGSVDAGSLFEAVSLPSSALINGLDVSTVNNPNFVR